MSKSRSSGRSLLSDSVSPLGEQTHPSLLSARPPTGPTWTCPHHTSMLASLDGASSKARCPPWAKGGPRALSMCCHVSRLPATLLCG